MLALIAALEISIIVHEAGHAIMAKILGYKIKPFMRFKWHLPYSLGMGVIVPELPMDRNDDLCIALAGPIASLTLAALAANLDHTLSQTSLLIGALNLIIPVKGSDGWRILKCL